VSEEKIEIVKPEVPEEGAGSRGPIYTGTSNGFIINFENGVKLYFSGDTALFGDMKFVIGDYYKPDIAFLSASDTFTMDPIDAAFATTWINPQIRNTLSLPHIRHDCAGCRRVCG